MTYLSGLMLGVSVANMLRRTLGGTGGADAVFARGMRGGYGRGDRSVLSSLTGAFTGRPSARLPSPERSGGIGRAGREVLPAGGSAVKDPAPALPYRTHDPAECPPFTCVHASPGRRRYRTPYLTAAFGEVLEEYLVRLPFVRAVRANAVAGSILLVYAPEDEAHILVLAEGLAAIFAEGRTPSPPATLAQSVRRSVHDFSGWIQRHTGGALDLSSTVAGIFVLRGIRQLVLGGSAPSGSQMLWWALALMRGWRV